MSVTWNIIDDGSILCLAVTEPYANADFSAFYEQDRLHRDRVLRTNPTKKIHLVIDLSQVDQFSDGFLQMRQSPSFSHLTGGFIVVVGANNLLKGICEAIFKVSRFEHRRFFDSVDEGIAFLREQSQQEAFKRRTQTA